MPNEQDDLGERLASYIDRAQNSVTTGAFGEAENTVDDVFSLALQSCADNPTPEFELSVAAIDCEERGDWIGAEAAYKQILELPEEQSAGGGYSTLSKLAVLYRVLNRKADALHYASMAVTAARKQGFPLLRILFVVFQSRLFINYDQINAARLGISEALAEIGEDEQYNHIRGELLILLAHSQVKEESLLEAEENLATAYQLFGNWKDFQMAAGVQSGIARWWSVQGMIHTAKREFAQAIEAWQRAVEISRQINELEHCRDVYTRITIARMLRGLADAFKDSGRTDQAESAKEEAEAILSSVGLPTD